ncbi:hypothetical protein Syun_014760 [Stephania yunnanensis]|uniref:Pentatricopeptide repeat-containing protein n=1 Tax=Stephania yunnanensis TaxID=152371 RepID=A0AAP0PC57_9MAGN
MQACGIPMTSLVKLYRATNHENLIHYTKLLASHVNDSRHHQALALFHQIHHASPSLPLDPFVFPLAIKSCSALHLPRLGTAIHAHTAKLSFASNPFVACALVDMYGKCASISLARQLFDEIPYRNVVVWNAMISLYAGYGDVGAALELFETMDVVPNASSFNTIMGAFGGMGDGSCGVLKVYRRMREAGVEPNLITVLALLPACVGVAALAMVKQVHGYSIRNGIYGHPHLSSGLVEAYGRCGCLVNAQGVFDKMDERDVVAWTSMISAYALHGDVHNALFMLREMEPSRVKPDGITFLVVLKACSHAGLADEALKCFKQMRMCYGVEANSEHYSCLVDVLSRAGRLFEAYEVIGEMPMKATAKAWGALLGACRVYGEVELAEIAGRVLFELELENAANYVLLASIYAGAGKFEEAEEVRKDMNEKGLKASPGSSWVMDHE